MSWSTANVTYSNIQGGVEGQGNLDVDPEAPRFYSMPTPARFIGGPNPHGD